MRIVCLANSKKLGGRCVAGIDLVSHEWVRPVHEREGGEFHSTELQHDRGAEIDLLDVVEFKVVADASTLYHPEDVLAYGGWHYTREATPADFAVIDELLEQGPNILGSTSASVAPPTKPSDALESSLALVRPGGQIVFHKDRDFGKLRCRVRFRLTRHAYDLPVTDPVILARIGKCKDGNYAPSEIGVSDNPYLTISLGEPFALDGKCYKLVAAVFPR